MNTAFLGRLVSHPILPRLFFDDGFKNQSRHQRNQVDDANHHTNDYFGDGPKQTGADVMESASGEDNPDSANRRRVPCIASSSNGLTVRR